MDYFVGLDVSLETVSICIVNAAGDILLEKKIAAEPAAIVGVLKHFGHPLKRIGLEAGPTSSWLYSELRHRLSGNLPGVPTGESRAQRHEEQNRPQ